MDRQTHKHTNTHTHIFQPDYRKFIVKSSYRSEICLQQIFLKVMNYLFSPKTFSVGVTVTELTLILLTWTIWRAPTNASKWRMGFNSAFKGLSKVHEFAKQGPRKPMKKVSSQPVCVGNLNCYLSWVVYMCRSSMWLIFCIKKTL